MNQQDFNIELREDGVFLTVAPDGGVSAASVVSAVKRRGLKKFDNGAILKAIEEKSGLPVRISDPVEVGPTEASFRIKISDDGLSCDMWYIPETGGALHPTIEQVKGEMNSHGVVFGHDEEAIKKMLGGPIVKQWVVTAKGIPPVNGKDAKVDYKVDLDVFKPKAVGENVNMKELGAVINVVKDQLIAEKIPAIKGTEGMTVLGKKINIYVGKDITLPAGKGVTLSEDKMKMFADCDGNLQVKDKKLSVNPTFEVKGDVDYGVGNIDFVGPVTVKGAVREGFEVKSGAELVIDDVVEGATLYSVGNTTIKKGVRGTGKAKISAKGDINIGYIDQAFIRSEGSVLVTDVILHSDVGAKVDVKVTGDKKGQIVGGRIMAGNEVLCTTLGGEMETKTEVMVGELPEVLEERKQTQERLKDLETQLEKLEANLSFLKALQQKNQLTPDKQELLAKLSKAKFQYKAMHNEATSRLKTLEGELNKQDGCVRVRNTCYPGVIITIKGVRYLVREKLRFAKFVYEAGEIRIKAFD
ncbi:polymerase [Synergistales bacterium]|nr:polymerase [Synergistales bacterium]